MMGKNDEEEETRRELLDLPFPVFYTKYGKVYHINQNCRHINHMQTCFQNRGGAGTVEFQVEIEDKYNNEE